MEIVYLEHPVTIERKKELRAAGYKILDIRFAPDGWQSPLEKEQSDEDLYADENAEKDNIIASLAEYGVTRDRRTSLDKLRELLAEEITKANEAE